jgi:hypothetical protein
MLDVVPELNPEGEHPQCVRQSLEASAEDPQTTEHNQSVEIVQHL